jgi:hypothetical protein
VPNPTLTLTPAAHVAAVLATQANFHRAEAVRHSAHLEHERAVYHLVEWERAMAAIDALAGAEAAQ